MMKPLASTVRVIEWEELPPRARNIPDNFNPLIEGILMVHQIECLKVKKSIFAIPKGRRTGITFTFGFEAVLTAAARKSIGGMDVYYIGDTKEKGLEFIGYCAKFSRTVAEQQANAVSHIEEFLFEDQDEHGNTQHITAYRIRYASGNRVVVLSSRPANIRGLQGLVIIDEAAFHQDVRGVLDAATALLIWGGRIVIISSHNGKSNPFNQFVNDIQNGLYGDDAVVYT
ncbi:terminase large subunit domain-containing protein, partial [Yersinia pseudotuberculosis]